MKSSMIPWPTFTLLAISLLLTVISLLSPTFLRINNNTNDNFLQEEYQQQQKQQQPMSTTTSSSESIRYKNLNNHFHQIQPSEIERVAYKLSNIENNRDSQRGSRYQVNSNKNDNFLQFQPDESERVAYKLSENNQEVQRPRYQEPDISESREIPLPFSPEQNYDLHEQQPHDRETTAKLEIKTLEASPLKSNFDQTKSSRETIINNDRLQIPVRKALEESFQKDNQNKNNAIEKQETIIKSENKKVETDENILFLSASMALVFGAVSARKLVKKRRFLAGFFENDDSFEDELAYDIATTVSSSDGGMYGSFASPWIGDLEKFDV